ncbi:hypothetical protein AVEN_42179-1 [Araneus ventricosus]|uniref:Uncharacterized protein n=1 Tax=Araneus ventricosus TaxID=182803 RepID=A0A4Y2B0U8_ARAVE|nr:hypothetical protein AVEN_42179-1 [Araneus ventricosus]
MFSICISGEVSSSYVRLPVAIRGRVVPGSKPDSTEDPSAKHKCQSPLKALEEDRIHQPGRVGYGPSALPLRQSVLSRKSVHHYIGAKSGFYLRGYRGSPTSL